MQAEKVFRFRQPLQLHCADVLPEKVTPRTLILRITGAYHPPSPEISPSLLDRTRISADMSHAVLPPLISADESNDVLIATPGSREVSLVPVVPEIAKRSYELPMLSIDDIGTFLFSGVAVTENLLKPLERSGARGKDYAASKAMTRGLFDDWVPTDDQASRPDGETSKHKKAYRGARLDRGHIARQRATLWDLILPLLKPPLNLDFPDQLDFPGNLYPFQPEGAQTLFANESFLLADEMGTGKTVMSCVALRMLIRKGKVKRALIVCPTTDLSVWEEHLEDWGGADLQFTVVHGPRETRKIDWNMPAHVYLTTYATLRNDIMRPGGPLYGAESREQFDLVLLDEAQAIRNPDSKISQAVRKLQSSFRWALSGVPLQNGPEDIVSLFRFVKPGLFGREPLTPDEIKQRIAPYFLRRRKRDVLPELPDKTRQDIWLEMDPAQRAEYEDALAKGVQSFESGKVKLSRIHVFALISKLKQICNFANGRDKSPKMDMLLNQLSTIIDEHKAVVFSQYIGNGIEKIRNHLVPYGIVEITGSTSTRGRAQAIREFQKAPDHRVFLGSVKAAGEGITLTEGNYVFHFDHWWNPAVAWNAEDRVHRNGQKKHVTVYSYWMKDTIEERIYEILQRKGLFHEEIVNALSEKEIDKSITMEDWCEVLGLKPKFIRKQAATKRPSTSHRLLPDIYEKLSQVSPDRFEKLVAEVFRRSGYGRVKVTGGSRDGGVDVIATRSIMGGKEVVAIQCKRQSRVGPAPARDLLGVLTNSRRFTRGVLAVSGKASSACSDFVSKHGHLALIEGPQLAKRILDFDIAVDQ